MTSHNLDNAICFSIPSCSTPKRYSRNMRCSRYCMNPSAGSHENKHAHVQRTLDTLSHNKTLSSEPAVCFYTKQLYCSIFTMMVHRIFWGNLLPVLFLPPFKNGNLLSISCNKTFDICEIKRLAHWGYVIILRKNRYMYLEKQL